MMAEPPDIAVTTPDELMVAVLSKIHHDEMPVVSDLELPSE
jgi:hypothetical protein